MMKASKLFATLITLVVVSVGLSGCSKDTSKSVTCPRGLERLCTPESTLVLSADVINCASINAKKALSITLNDQAGAKLTAFSKANAGKLVILMYSGPSIIVSAVDPAKVDRKWLDTVATPNPQVLSMAVVQGSLGKQLMVANNGHKDFTAALAAFKRPQCKAAL